MLVSPGGEEDALGTAMGLLHRLDRGQHTGLSCPRFVVEHASDLSCCSMRRDVIWR